MNSVKLIALDIDGTLYNKDGVITSYNKKMIRKAVENGITVIISTGRPYIAWHPICHYCQRFCGIPRPGKGTALR